MNVFEGVPGARVGKLPDLQGGAMAENSSLISKAWLYSCRDTMVDVSTF